MLQVCHVMIALAGNVFPVTALRVDFWRVKVLLHLNEQFNCNDVQRLPKE